MICLLLEAIVSVSQKLSLTVCFLFKHLWGLEECMLNSIFLQYNNIRFSVWSLIWFTNQIFFKKRFGTVNFPQQVKMQVEKLFLSEVAGLHLAVLLKHEIRHRIFHGFWTNLQNSYFVEYFLMAASSKSYLQALLAIKYSDEY